MASAGLEVAQSATGQCAATEVGFASAGSGLQSAVRVAASLRLWSQSAVLDGKSLFCARSLQVVCQSGQVLHKQLAKQTCLAYSSAAAGLLGSSPSSLQQAFHTRTRRIQVCSLVCCSDLFFLGS